MKRLFCTIFFLVSLNVTNPFAAQSSLNTIQFPSGAENTGLGGIGVSIPNSIYSVFWNPANVACLYEENYLNHIYSRFHEDLLPSFGIPGVYHDFTTFSTTLNNVFPHIDIGYAYSRNFINLGFDDLTIPVNDAGVSMYSSEKIISNSIGIRAFDLISLGASFKQYSTEPAAWVDKTVYPNGGKIKDNIYDAGIRINKKLDIMGLFYVNPSIGVSVLNMCKDNIGRLEVPSQYFSMHKTGILGGSCEFNLLDLFEYDIIYESSFNMYTKPKERIKNYGHKFEITPFYSILRGTLTDTAGNRYEKSNGYVIGFNYRKGFLMVSKVMKLMDMMIGSDNYNKMMQWDNSLNFGGFEFRPNLFFSECCSEIKGDRPGQVRDGQVQKDLSVGIGVIGSFPDCFGKNKN